MFSPCRYVFKRLKFLGNKTLSMVITMLLISVWHGVWPGYYICFTLEGICLAAESQVPTVCMGEGGGGYGSTTFEFRIPSSNG